MYLNKLLTCMYTFISNIDPRFALRVCVRVCVYPYVYMRVYALVSLIERINVSLY